MSSSKLYTDLSSYYDLMCADINYAEQSDYVRRLHQLFGNQGKRHLDLACGTGPHVRHFLDIGYESQGLDINQPMLDIASERCPEARFFQQDMCNFKTEAPQDLITCFLYSIHYNDNIQKLQETINSVFNALASGGVFCFNTVDKNAIDNRDGIKRSLTQGESEFIFQSGWRYPGSGDRQYLSLNIERKTGDRHENWQDQHPMVALGFQQMQDLLTPFFEVHIFEHDFTKITPWKGSSGNAIFLAIKN